MAKIWRVYEGKEPTVGGPWVRLPLSEAIEIFELRPGDFVSDLAKTPRFGDEKRDLRHFGFRHIVVEVEDDEAQRVKWKPGFYRVRITPFVKKALAAKLGDENIVRVEPQSTADSLGRDALKVTVVIPPGAAQKLNGRTVLDALVELQKRLRDIGEDRIPIVEYATEAELVEDGGPQS